MLDHKKRIDQLIEANGDMAAIIKELYEKSTGEKLAIVHLPREID